MNELANTTHAAPARTASSFVEQVFMSSSGIDRRLRCEATIAGQGVDRTAAYIPAIACDISSQILGRRAHTGTGSLHFAEVAAWADGDEAHAEFEAGMLRDLAEVHRALDIDIIRIPWRMNRRPTKRLDEFTFLFGDPDGAHSVWRYMPRSADFGPISSVSHGPAADVRLHKQVQDGEAGDDSMRKAARAQVEEAQRLAERFGGEFFFLGAGGAISVGMSEDDLVLLATEPDWVRRKVMLQAKMNVAVGEELAKCHLPHVMDGGGDLAGAQGPFFSPRAFREVLLPAYKYALDRLNSLGVHYYFRSDGDIWPLAEMLFAEAACPGFGEADRDAGMTVDALRGQFPALVIWGNFPSCLLVHGTAEQVKEESKRIIDESAGVGYFHGCSNAIVKGTPPANVEAMFSVR